MNKGIEVFNAGGGIIIAAVDINTTQYAVVSTEAPEYLSVYDRVEDEEPYLPEDMVFSMMADALKDDMKALHAEMVKKIQG